MLGQNTSTPEASGEEPGPVSRSPGEVLSGRYRLDEQIGQGGAGAVFVGFDLILEQRVAVKLVHLEGLARHAPDHPDRAGLRAEAVAAMRLAHPNISRVFTYQREATLEYLVMEHVEGVNLSRHRRQRSNRRLPCPEAIQIALGVLEGLAVAHDADVVHNDIKPGNIMVTPRGGVKLLDFGLARAPNTRPEGEYILGTAAFMSPERFRGEVVDARSDLYAVGALLYTLAVGRTPFGRQLAEAAEGHLRRPVPPSSALPRLLHSVIACAMAKDPAQRFHTAGAMCTALLNVRSAVEQEAVDDPDTDFSLDEQVDLSGVDTDYAMAATEPVSRSALAEIIAAEEYDDEDYDYDDYDEYLNDDDEDSAPVMVLKLSVKKVPRG